jgi:hypothetical protein
MARKAVVDNPVEHSDYIEHGSEAHANFLGLRLATSDDNATLIVKDKKGRGWVLVDMTMFGPSATEAYLHEVCRQKVAEVDAGAPPTLQSEDPRKPNYAPPLWQPPEP